MVERMVMEVYVREWEDRVIPFGIDGYTSGTIFQEQMKLGFSSLNMNDF
jgi:hypothetical protein